MLVLRVGVGVGAGCDVTAWVSKIHHQTCHVVYTDYRPTPLQHYMFPSGGDGLYLVVDDKGRFRESNFQRAMASLTAAALDDPEAAAGGKKKKKGRKGGKRGPTDLFRVVKMIMERRYDPVIVFSFRCVALRCVALRCVVLRCVALCCHRHWPPLVRRLVFPHTA